MRYLGLILAALLLVDRANASFIGDVVSSDRFWLTPTTATIGPGDEFSFSGLEYLDFGESTLRIHGERGNHYWSNFGHLTFTGFDSVITDLSIASNIGYSGDILSGFSFTANSISLNWGDSRREGLGELVFQIQTEPSAVPAPATLWLLGCGLLGLGLGRRRAA